MKRKSFYTTLITAVLAAVLLIGCGIIFLRSARYGEAVLKNIVKEYNTTPTLGQLFNLEVNCVLPWGQNIDSINYLPGEGLVMQGAISSRNTAFSLKGRTTKITVPVRSCRPGKVEPGAVNISVTRTLHHSAVKKQSLSSQFSPVEISPLKVENPDQLPLAGDYQKPANRSYALWYGIAGAVMLLPALLAWLIFRYSKRRSREQEILPPWEIARRNLDELRKTADAGKQPLAWCVARLSDVVREYLSVRYCWRVKQQTTEEFFAALKRKNSPLTAGQTFYLEEFMKQADLIKFANIKPDKDAFALAADRAEELIEQTALPDKSEEANEVNK